MKKCQTNCSDQATIDAFFDNSVFNVVYVNNYFDYGDFKTPVKPFIDDSLFWELESNKAKKANFYVMKSEANLEDELFQLGQTNDFEFSQASNQRTYEDSYSEWTGLVAFYIRYDYRYDVYQR